MTITTKENANGRITACCVDGVKIRKSEIDLLIRKCSNEIMIEQFPPKEAASFMRRLIA